MLIQVRSIASVFRQALTVFGRLAYASASTTVSLIADPAFNRAEQIPRKREADEPGSANSAILDGGI
jgi:hypothetical protein